MSGIPPPASPWGGVELLERAIGYARGALTLVGPDLMGAPTPCSQWDLRALLLHLEDSLTSLHEAGATRRVEREPVPSPTEDLVGAIRRRACALLADWTASTSDTGGGATRRDVLVQDRPLTSPVLASAGALEVAVHGWDVATACGAWRPLPDDLASDLLRIAPVLVTAADRPHRFALPVVCPGDSSAGTRLLAFLGRRVR